MSSGGSRSLLLAWAVVYGSYATNKHDTRQGETASRVQGGCGRHVTVKVLSSERWSGRACRVVVPAPCCRRGQSYMGCMRLISTIHGRERPHPKYSFIASDLIFYYTATMHAFQKFHSSSSSLSSSSPSFSSSSSLPSSSSSNSLPSSHS